jgi:Bacterial mobilisation protein (MobC)
MTKPINTDDGKKAKPSLGRPRTNRVKDHWISFRVTAEEHFALLDKARRSDLTAGEYARSRALRGIARAKKTAATPAELFGDRTRAVLHELRKQGANLNQIAHHCNRHQLPPPLEVIDLATQLKTLWQKLMS